MLILTKPLGPGIIGTAAKDGEDGQGAIRQAIGLLAAVAPERGVAAVVVLGVVGVPRASVVGVIEEGTGQIRMSRQVGR